MTIDEFIARWKDSGGGSEQANSQLFLTELCGVLGLPAPKPAGPVNEENTYCFERKLSVPRDDGTRELRRIDLYRKGHFVLESKQGQDKAPKQFQRPGLTFSGAVKRGSPQWNEAMGGAKRQAENYIRSLPATEGRPPFIIVCDVGHCFDIYSEFTCTGGIYLPFPDARRRRIRLDDLAKPDVQKLFRGIWSTPLELDPSRHAARVTEEIASHLAKLARLLEANGHAPEKVAQFLMRCIFSMFAGGVKLIPKGSFTDILNKATLKPKTFKNKLQNLWSEMNKGGYSSVLDEDLPEFNGKIFANPEVLPLDRQHIDILLEASKYDWKDVEPAIFGTLLERALNPKERHKLGAHYTPRAYVERLVIPTIMQPLRKDWDGVQAAASLLFNAGKKRRAYKIVNDFHEHLRTIKILDPACGSGNFLYVTLEHFKRLEDEILQTLESYGDTQQKLLLVDPKQFHGLEINPRAAHIAEMVLWIGYLQWHYRTHGNIRPQPPIIHDYRNIKHQDALITWKSQKPAVDKDGRPITRWDGETYKADPVTGRNVPDEKATVQDVVYEGVAAAKWPLADFVIGNPPFIGGKDKRQALGYGYFDSLTKAYPLLPEACDFVMYWWHKAAEEARAGQTRRFGFITTNSLPQVFNRRVVGLHLGDKNPLHLAFAIPNHPWVDAADGAAVRISMTVGEKGAGEGVLATVLTEDPTNGREIAVTLAEQTGVIHADLRQGADITSAVPLAANSELCSRGMALHGAGFIVTPAEAAQMGLGKIKGLDRHIRPYRNGDDINGNSRDRMVIDLQGLTAEEVRKKYSAVYHRVRTLVKPERDTNNEKYRRENWWVFGRKHTELRSALAGLPRYISTSETAKHRFFVFLPAEILPDNKLVNIASSDAYHLGVLSSRIHVCWALAAGGRLGVGNDPVYSKTTCFDPFPFPFATPKQQARIRDLAQQLDGHRKQRQALHTDLTMTGMYNVLNALREKRALTNEEIVIDQKGLVTNLLDYHDDLDAAVADAYGWPADLTDDEILSRLVKLNAERAAEEESGTIRYLRPEYQDKEGRKATQATLGLGQQPATGKKATTAKQKKVTWPSSLPEQTLAVRDQAYAFRKAGIPVKAETVAKQFIGTTRAKVEEILQTLETLGFT